MSGPRNKRIHSQKAHEGKRYPTEEAFPSLDGETGATVSASGAWRERLVVGGKQRDRSSNDSSAKVSTDWADDDAEWSSPVSQFTQNGEEHDDTDSQANVSTFSSKPVVTSEWTVGGTSDLSGTGTVRVLTTAAGREKLRYIRPYQGRKPFYVERQRKLREQWEEEERLRRLEEEDDDDQDGPWIYQPAHFELGLNINALVQEIHFNTIDHIELVDVERTNVFTDYELMPVAMALRHNTSVEALVIKCLPCTDYSLVPLFESLIHHPTIRKLEVSAIEGRSSSTGKALVELVTQNPNIVDLTVTECPFLTEMQQETIDTAAQYNLLKVPELQRTQIQKQQTTIMESGCHPASAAGESSVTNPVDVDEYPREARRILRSGGKPPICGEHMEKVTNMIIPKRQTVDNANSDLPPPPAYQEEIPDHQQYKPRGCRFGNRCLLRHPTPSVSKGSSPKDNVPVNTRPELFFDTKENKLLTVESQLHTPPEKGSGLGCAGGNNMEGDESRFSLPSYLVDKARGKKLGEKPTETSAEMMHVQTSPQDTAFSASSAIFYAPVIVGVVCIVGVSLALRK